jgi:hypothetical protein
MEGFRTSPRLRDAEVHALRRLGSAGDEIERGVELGHVAGLDDNVEFSQVAWPEAELAPRKTPSFDRTFLLQVTHVARHGPRELDVLHARL